MQQFGRPREFNVDETLSKIMELFWENGYEATGLSDLVKATGIGKASLYAAFGNKQAMYLKALTHYELLIVNAAVSVLKGQNLTPWERVNAYLSSPIIALRDHNDQRGCFLCNAAADRAALDEETGKLVRRGYNKMHIAIAGALIEALPGTSETITTTRAQLILTVYSGLRVMARSGVSINRMERAKDEVLRSSFEPIAS